MNKSNNIKYYTSLQNNTKVNENMNILGLLVHKENTA